MTKKPVAPGLLQLITRFSSLTLHQPLKKTEFQNLPPVHWLIQRERKGERERELSFLRSSSRRSVRQRNVEWKTIGNGPTSNGIIPRLTVVKGKKRGINKQEDVVFIDHPNGGNEFSYLRSEVKANLLLRFRVMQFELLDCSFFFFFSLHIFCEYS